MNYDRIYTELIRSRSELKRKKIVGDGLEKHHIKPKCFGGSNKKDNLVLLTPREHFIAHLLLTKLYTGKEKAKMVYAVLKMCSVNRNQKRIVTSKEYELAKLLVSKHCKKENNFAFGYKHTEEEKNKIRNRMIDDKNHAFGKSPWNKGLTIQKHSEETKEKMRISHTGRKKSEQHKLNLSNSLKGKSKSEDHKKKLSESLTGRKVSSEIIQKTSAKLRGRKHPIVKCPHCNKIGGKIAMSRWHFDKCNHK